MPHSIDKKLSPRDCLKLILKGFLMGTANAIPGVSGGTIAFMVGIYEDLLLSIQAIDLSFFKNIFSFKITQALKAIPLKFLFFLMTGVITAIITLSKVITWLIYHKPIFIYSFFFGLILATVPIIAKVLKKWSLSIVFLIALSTYLTFLLVNSVPVQTPNSLWFIFVSGMIAITSMILPGISGSFMLLMLGKYLYIMEAIINRDFLILGVFSLGALIGILLFVRILNWLFDKFHDQTIAILTGFVIGSLSKIWPWKNTIEIIETTKGKIIPVKEINILPIVFDQYFFFACLLIVLGFFTALIIDRSSAISIDKN